MAKKQPSCFRKIDADKNQNLLDNFDKKYLQGAAVGLSPPLSYNSERTIPVPHPICDHEFAILLFLLE